MLLVLLAIIFIIIGLCTYKNKTLSELVSKRVALANLRKKEFEEASLDLTRYILDLHKPFDHASYRPEDMISQTDEDVRYDVILRRHQKAFILFLETHQKEVSQNKHILIEYLSYFKEDEEFSDKIMNLLIK